MVYMGLGPCTSTYTHPAERRRSGQARDGQYGGAEWVPVCRCSASASSTLHATRSRDLGNGRCTDTPAGTGLMCTAAAVSRLPSYTCSATWRSNSPCMLQHQYNTSTTPVQYEFDIIYTLLDKRQECCHIIRSDCCGSLYSTYTVQLSNTRDVIPCQFQS